MKNTKILLFRRICLFLTGVLMVSFVLASAYLEGPVNLMSYRGQTGQVFEFVVEGKASGRLWGSEIYTDDSELAVAAVHAGILKPEESGSVKVKILPGQSEYAASIQYGVQSQEYGTFGGSFQIVGFQKETIPTYPDPGNLIDYRNRNGETFKFLVKGLSSGNCWGANPYTDDSLLALTAVHSGAVQAGKYGIVEVTLLAGQSNYIGSPQNGIVSLSYGSWVGSYEVHSVQVDDAIITDDTSITIAEAPGSLTEYRDQVGSKLRFRVIGSDAGRIWGTSIYTDDSTLALVCVHAGVLKIGETGIVEVTVLPGQTSYEGSLQNGITSNSYGSWTGSYSVLRVNP